MSYSNLYHQNPAEFEGRKMYSANVYKQTDLLKIYLYLPNIFSCIFREKVIFMNTKCLLLRLKPALIA